jgi:hypothetical protein
VVIEIAPHQQGVSIVEQGRKRWAASQRRQLAASRPELPQRHRCRWVVGHGRQSLSLTTEEFVSSCVKRGGYTPPTFRIRAGSETIPSLSSASREMKFVGAADFRRAF